MTQFNASARSREMVTAYLRSIFDADGHFTGADGVDPDDFLLCARVKGEVIADVDGDVDATSALLDELVRLTVTGLARVAEAGDMNPVELWEQVAAGKAARDD